MEKKPYAATEMGRLDAELCKEPCDGHFRGWDWLYDKIHDKPEQIAMAEEMIRKAIAARKAGTKLNLTYWYKSWYGLDYGSNLEDQTRDKEAYSVKFGYRS